MCFAPQRRALFRHLNFQKWSDNGVALCILTWKCASRHNGVHFFNISTSKVVREWCVLYIFTSKCASRHNGVHFFDISTSKKVRSWGVLRILTWKCASRHNDVQLFISHLASWLRTRRFSEPTFRPSGATNRWKNTAFHDFPTFSRTCTFFLLTLSLLLFSILLLHLCFSSVHIVGSLTSKLPSMIFCCCSSSSCCCCRWCSCWCCWWCWCCCCCCCAVLLCCRCRCGCCGCGCGCCCGCCCCCCRVGGVCGVVVLLFVVFCLQHS